MAFHSSLLLISLILAAARAVPGLALVIKGKPITSVAIGGVIYCSIDGNRPYSGPASIISGAPVELRCGSGSGEEVQKTAFTDHSGKYYFDFDVDSTHFYDPSKCSIVVHLPLGGSCVLAPHKGLLRAPISVGSVAQVSRGNLLVCVQGAFKHFP